MYIAYSESYCH